jgi:hypothetical protein
MTPNAWALFDVKKQKYLTTGKSLIYGHATNPAEAHLYFREEVAGRQACIMLSDHSGKKPKLQIIPMVVELGTPIDVEPQRKINKTGYGVYVEVQTDYMTVPYKGFWKRPPYITESNAEMGNRSLYSKGQKADVWKTRETAEKWADLMERHTRAKYANSSHSAKLLHFKVVVKGIK